MSYKRVLILSDNLRQCISFENILQALDLPKIIDVTFACSIYSNKEAFEKELNLKCDQLDLKDSSTVDNLCTSFDLIFSIHCKQLFPSQLVNSVKCINLHPGYNPYNRGWYPQIFAIINDTIFGATIHEIDEQLDHGKIIDRIEVRIESWETSYDLYEKVLDAEIELLERNLLSILENSYIAFNPEFTGDVYLKKDFNKLCQLNLDEVQTTRDFLNKIRALSHKPFKNAYFVDPNSNKRIFVSIDFEIEE